MTQPSNPAHGIDSTEKAAAYLEQVLRGEKRAFDLSNPNNTAMLGAGAMAGLSGLRSLTDKRHRKNWLRKALLSGAIGGGVGYAAPTIGRWASDAMQTSDLSAQGKLKELQTELQKATANNDLATARRLRADIASLQSNPAKIPPSEHNQASDDLKRSAGTAASIGAGGVGGYALGVGADHANAALKGRALRKPTDANIRSQVMQDLDTPAAQQAASPILDRNQTDSLRRNTAPNPVQRRPQFRMRDTVRGSLGMPAPKVPQGERLFEATGLDNAQLDRYTQRLGKLPNPAVGKGLRKVMTPTGMAAGYLARPLMHKLIGVDSND